MKRNYLNDSDLTFLVEGIVLTFACFLAGGVGFALLAELISILFFN